MPSNRSVRERSVESSEHGFVHEQAPSLHTILAAPFADISAVFSQPGSSIQEAGPVRSAASALRPPPGSFVGLLCSERRISAIAIVTSIAFSETGGILVSVLVKRVLCPSSLVPQVGTVTTGNATFADMAFKGVSIPYPYDLLFDPFQHPYTTQQVEITKAQMAAEAEQEEHIPPSTAVAATAISAIDANRVHSSEEPRHPSNSGDSDDEAVCVRATSQSVSRASPSPNHSPAPFALMASSASSSSASANQSAASGSTIGDKTMSGGSSGAGSGGYGYATSGRTSVRRPSAKCGYPDMVRTALLSLGRGATLKEIYNAVQERYQDDLDWEAAPNQSHKTRWQSNVLQFLCSSKEVIKDKVAGCKRTVYSLASTPTTRTLSPRPPLALRDTTSPSRTTDISRSPSPLSISLSPKRRRIGSDEPSTRTETVYARRAPPTTTIPASGSLPLADTSSHGPRSPLANPSPHSPYGPLAGSVPHSPLVSSNVPCSPLNAYVMQMTSGAPHSPRNPYNPHSPLVSAAPHSPYNPMANAAPQSPRNPYNDTAPLSPHSTYNPMANAAPPSPHNTHNQHSPMANGAPHSPHNTYNPMANAAPQSPHTPYNQHSLMANAAPHSPHSSYVPLARCPSSPHSPLVNAAPQSPHNPYGPMVNPHPHSPHHTHHTNNPTSPMPVNAVPQSPHPHSPYNTMSSNAAPYTPSAQPAAPQSPHNPYHPPLSPSPSPGSYSSYNNNNPHSPMVYATAPQSPHNPYNPNSPMVYATAPQSPHNIIFNSMSNTAPPQSPHNPYAPAPQRPQNPYGQLARSTSSHLNLYNPNSPYGQVTNDAPQIPNIPLAGVPLQGPPRSPSANHVSPQNSPHSPWAPTCNNNSTSSPQSPHHHRPLSRCPSCNGPHTTASAMMTGHVTGYAMDQQQQQHCDQPGAPSNTSSSSSCPPLLQRNGSGTLSAFAAFSQYPNAAVHHQLLNEPILASSHDILSSSLMDDTYISPTQTGPP